MDSSTLITTALTIAASEIGKDALSDAAKGAYSKLKGLLQKRFHGNQVAQTALAKAEVNPKEAESTLKQAIIDTRADQHPEIVESARALLSIVRPHQASVGKYNTNISGDVQGFVQGDNATINMNITKD